MKKLYLLILFTIAASGAFAQNSSCAQAVRLAQSVYDQGRLHELEDLIKKAIDNQAALCGQAERISLLKLLTLTYIYLEEPEKADAAMLNLLQTNPYFKPNKEVDPAEFTALYKTFRTRPVYRIGARFGVNLTQPNVASFNTISDGESYYDFKLGIGGGVTGEYLLNSKLKVIGEVHLLQRKFSNTSISNFLSIDENGNTVLTEYSSSVGFERQSWLSIPILIQYELSQREDQKIIPIVEAGVATDLLLSSEIEIERKRIDNQSLDSKTFSNIDQRNRLNLSIVAGAGVRIPIAKGYLTADVRYYHGLTANNAVNTLFADQQKTFDYILTDGIFNLNSTMLSVGYVQNFFNPKKLRRKHEN
jgi:hypothetical protein